MHPCREADARAGVDGKKDEGLLDCVGGDSAVELSFGSGVSFHLLRIPGFKDGGPIVKITDETSNALVNESKFVCIKLNTQGYHKKYVTPNDQKGYHKKSRQFFCLPCNVTSNDPNACNDGKVKLDEMQQTACPGGPSLVTLYDHEVMIIKTSYFVGGNYICYSCWSHPFKPSNLNVGLAFQNFLFPL